MEYFGITQPADGVVLGVFEAYDELSALDSLAQDAGYDDRHEGEFDAKPFNIENVNCTYLVHR